MIEESDATTAHDDNHVIPADADIDAVIKDRLQELGISGWFVDAWRLTDGTVSPIFGPLVERDEKLSALMRQLTKQASDKERAK